MLVNKHLPTDAVGRNTLRMLSLQQKGNLSMKSEKTKEEIRLNDNTPRKSWAKPTIETIIAVKQTESGGLAGKPEDATYRPS